MTVYVRFAPSPTGYLHIGNIRAALYNYLFARRQGGRFLLRLDDTDQERSTPEYAAAIEEDMRWLGLNWDAFEKQSARTVRYDEELERLKKSGRVYPCFETQGELDLKRKTQLGRGLPPVYDRAALKLTPEGVEKLIADGHKPHWRFKLDPIDVTWNDGVQGPKSLPASALSDPVIVREDGVPLYTFCSIVDDIDMGITHIIRGEDHVTNTSVQIQIWNALTDKPAPAFAHYPLLVSADGTPMSKRLGTLSIRQMREESHIEAMAINSLLAKLGTSDPIAPYQDIETLAASFDLGKISRATPKFDMQDLKHLNAKILHQTPYAAIKDRLAALQLADMTESFWNAVRPNLETLDDTRLWWEITHQPVASMLGEDAAFLADAAALLPPAPWDETTWSSWTNAVKAKTSRKGKELFMPLRRALTGLDHGPEMKALLPLIGYERSIKRLKGETA
ncbi:MAG: glutamate--tRNA ligase [Proteobacteria bacterium]|jgi:glutamyl-tRNA synthetase|nr:glutamate--tRNA ligase [Alphaproteobacteria bacterium]NCC02866.1 glutamate--tRNA ligase [Pseudomonadota bacterium]